MKETRRFYPRFHLGPMSGWLNDPNGLCQLSGVHHIFFQHSPDNPKGGEKCWGHYETKDFVNYRFTGEFMRPDTDKDRDGVYSGCAFVKDGQMYLFYTGNVKHAGDYDYVLEGRDANTMLVISKDGVSATAKECLMEKEDYPRQMSCHVRDPKVFSQEGRYYMVQGARTREDEGCVLLFTSEDLHGWMLKRIITRPDFGYMWECPDLFWVSGKAFLSVSPQGLRAEEYRFQNVYQSGYFPLGRWNVEDATDLEEFYEWDYGFDFYAPQTYEDEKGRRILIGWMGVPDAAYDHDPTIAEGWQHMLTIPRQIQVDDVSGRLLQKPLEEMAYLRQAELFWRKLEDEAFFHCVDGGYELLVSKIAGKQFSISFCEGLTFSYCREKAICTLAFSDEQVGYGRDERRLRLFSEELKKLRIFVDRCSIEIFLNDGEAVMTTKYFPREGGKLRIEGTAEVQGFQMSEISITGE